MRKIKLIICDDHTLFRQGMKKIVEGLSELVVVGEAANGSELLVLIEQQKIMPDILLLDLDMPVMNGIEATDIIRKKYPDIKIIVLSVHDDEQYIIQMIEKGADGYLFKNTDFSEVEKAIRDVAEKGFYINEHIMTAMRKTSLLKNKPRTFKNTVNITAREMEVLKLICNEMTASEIAENLFISIRTVDGHRQNLLDKTGARNTAGLVIYAAKNGLLDLGM